MYSDKWINIARRGKRAERLTWSAGEEADDGVQADRTLYPLCLVFLFVFPCSFFVFLRSCACLSLSVMSFLLYFSVRGFSPLLRVCVPLTPVLFLLCCSLVSIVSVFSFFSPFCILLVPVFCSAGPLLSCSFFWVYFLSFSALLCSFHCFPIPPPPPLLFFLWLFIRPENVDNNRGMASVGGQYGVETWPWLKMGFLLDQMKKEMNS